MEIIADFKRSMFAGRMVHTVYHREFKGRDEKGEIIYGDKDMGIRPVTIVQSSQFAMKTTKTDGKVVDSWCNWPKKSECIFNQDGSITITETSDRDNKVYKILTYLPV